VVTDPPTRARGVWLAALLLTSAAGWLLFLGLAELARAHLILRAFSSAQSQMVGPVLTAVVVTTFMAERVWPAVPRPARARAHMVDAAYFFVYAAAVPLVTLLNTGFAVAVGRYAHVLVLERLPFLPKAMGVAIILVGIDAMNWVAHWGNHRSSPLWRFHALHHSQEEMSVLTTFRTHPLTHASYLPALIPAVVLEANGAVPTATLVVYGSLVAVSHANLPWQYGPLGRVLISPGFHRLHHASSAVDGKQVVNFGFVLTVWDRMARTAAFPGSTTPVPTGIEGRPVAVEQAAPGRRLLPLVAEQLSQPFRLRSGLEG